MPHARNAERYTNRAERPAQNDNYLIGNNGFSVASTITATQEGAG